MPLPTFTRLDGGGDFIFSRPDLYPARHTITPRQRIGISNAGLIQVATLSPPEERFTLSFEGLTAADVTGLRAFLEAVNWSGAAFEYTDVAGAAQLVRYVDGTFEAPETSAGSYSLTLVLRMEIPWAP